MDSVITIGSSRICGSQEAFCLDERSRGRGMVTVVSQCVWDSASTVVSVVAFSGIFLRLGDALRRDGLTRGGLTCGGLARELGNRSAWPLLVTAGDLIGADAGAVSRDFLHFRGNVTHGLAKWSACSSVATAAAELCVCCCFVVEFISC